MPDVCRWHKGTVQRPEGRGGNEFAAFTQGRRCIWQKRNEPGDQLEVIARPARRSPSLSAVSRSGCTPALPYPRNCIATQRRSRAVRHWKFPDQKAEQVSLPHLPTFKTCENANVLPLFRTSDPSQVTLSACHLSEVSLDFDVEHQRLGKDK